MYKLTKSDLGIIEATKLGYKVIDGIMYRPLKPQLKTNTHGYKSLIFSFKNEKSDIGQISIKISRFIAYQKFKENLFQEGVQVRHLDDNSLNNKNENIALGTIQENWNDHSEQRKRDILISRFLNKPFYTEALKQQIIEDYNSSDLNYLEFIKLYDMSENTFRNMMKNNLQRPISPRTHQKLKIKKQLNPNYFRFKYGFDQYDLKNPQDIIIQNNT